MSFISDKISNDFYCLIKNNNINDIELDTDEYKFIQQIISNTMNPNPSNQPIDFEMYESLRQKIINSQNFKWTGATKGISPVIKEDSSLPQPSSSSIEPSSFLAGASSSLKSESSEAESCEEKNIINEKLLNEIKAEVKHHLFPSISHQISEEKARNAPPFMEMLSKKLSEKYDVVENFNIIQQHVVYIYFLYGVRGFFTNSHFEASTFIPGNKIPMKRPERFKIYFNELDKKQKLTLQDDKEYKELNAWYKEWARKELQTDKIINFNKPTLILINALVPALEKDFPNYKFQVKQTIEMILETLDIVQEIREEDYEESLEEKAFYEQNRCIVPEGAQTRQQLYKQMQEKALFSEFCKVIENLSVKNIIMYSKDLPEYMREKMNKDQEYRDWLACYKDWYYNNNNINSFAYNLTKDAISVLNSGLNNFYPQFRTLALTSLEIVKILKLAFEKRA